MRSIRAVVAFLLAACGSNPGESPDELMVSIDSSGTVPVITVSGAPPQWRLESLAVIGPEPGAGFSDIRSIALDPRGGVWVADVGERRLSRWGDDGGWIEDKGRVGSGPGEFRSPYRIAVHDQALLVLDRENARVVQFDLAAGTDTTWVSPTRVSGSTTDVRFFPNPDGPMLLATIAGSARDGVASPVYVRFDGRGSTIAVQDGSGSRLNDAPVCFLPDRSIASFLSPFSPRPRRVPLRQGTAEVVGGEYRIALYDRAGQLVRVMVRPAPRDSISDAEFVAENADWQKFTAEFPGVTCSGEIVRYRHKPAIRYLFPVEDGHLWVEQRLPGGGFRFEIWAGDSLLGALTAPTRLEGLPPAIGGDRLAVVAESPDGGHEVRLYRVVRSAP